MTKGLQSLRNLLVSLTLLATSWPAVSCAYTTVEIYVAWDEAAFESLQGAQNGGGLIRVNGEYQFTPQGVCGMQFENVEAWSWHDTSGFMNNLPSNAAPIPNNYNFQYTAPYAGCGANNYIFTTPATPGGEIPTGAERLVVQVPDASNVFYLNSSFDPVPMFEWPGEPDFPGVCETFPELCEPGDLTVCLTLFQPEQCEGDEMALPLFVASDSAARTVGRLNVAQHLLQKIGSPRGDLKPVLEEAQAEAVRAGRFLSSVSARERDSWRVSLQFAQLAVQQCENTVTEVHTDLVARRGIRLERVVERCRTAQALIDSLAQQQRAAQLKKLFSKRSSAK